MNSRAKHTGSIGHPNAAIHSLPTLRRGRFLANQGQNQQQDFYEKGDKNKMDGRITIYPLTRIHDETLQEKANAKTSSPLTDDDRFR